MHSVNPSAFDPVEESSEAALAFLLRPTGSPTSYDKSAGQVLEVAQVFGDAVVDIRHYGRHETVRLGLADDFAVPLECLPQDHHPVFQNEAGTWVATVSNGWAGFVDRGEVRTDLGDRISRDGRFVLEEGETLVLEVGQSVFVARLVWRSRKLPVPIGKDFDPVMAAVVGAMGLVAAVLGVVAASAPPPPESSRMGHLDSEILVELYRPKDVPAKAEVASPDKPASGGGNGPKEAKPTLDKRAGRPNEKVVQDSLDKIFGGAMAVLTENTLPSDMNAGIKGLIGSRGTQQPGAGGLTSGRCLSADCTGIGIATGDGIGDIGGRNRPGGTPGGEWGGDFKAKKTDGGDVALDGTIKVMGSAIDSAAIDRVVKAHLSQIKYCYSRELQKDPTIAGKVTVKFIIAADGSVSSATTERTTLGSPAAESCINGRFLRMQFPALKGDGIAIIKYPFLFAH